MAISRLLSVPRLFVKLLKKLQFAGLALRQAIGELQFAGFALCEAIRGVPTCRVLFCPKLLGDYHLKAPVLICLVSS